MQYVGSMSRRKIAVGHMRDKAISHYFDGATAAQNWAVDGTDAAELRASVVTPSSRSRCWLLHRLEQRCAQLKSCTLFHIPTSVSSCRDVSFAHKRGEREVFAP